MTYNIFIYGSCVSRDCFSDLPPNSINLIKYVARQSLLSSGSRAPLEDDEVEASISSFAERCLKEDFKGTLYNDLENLFHDDSFLVVDLVDERHGVFQFDDGSIATRSIELMEAKGISWIPPNAKLIEFGTAEHLELFEEAFEQFLGFLDERGWSDKLVVLKNRWATESVDGLGFEPSALGYESPQEANEIYSNYYAVVEQHRPSCLLTVPESLCKSDISHRWGLAPFHYIESFYTWVREAIFIYIDKSYENFDLHRTNLNSNILGSQSSSDSSVMPRGFNYRLLNTDSKSSYQSLEEFLDQGTVSEGIIEIDLGSLDLVMDLEHGDSSNLVVSFDSGLNQDELYPRFAPLPLSSGGDSYTLHLADPACQLSSSL